MRKPVLSAGQEWVWDYPRPPRLERSARLVRVVFAGREIARSSRSWRVLETSHPPVYYVPPDDIAPDALRPAAGTSFCEWKGIASYVDVVCGEAVASRAGWRYARPSHPFEELAGAVALYPGRVDAVYLDDELVRPQAGNFYGGWITSDIVGPFKGERGTEGW